jgi:hypothetical protein
MGRILGLTLQALDLSPLRGSTTKACNPFQIKVISAARGAVAQLGERSVRNAEVVGSIPIGSTKDFEFAAHSGGFSRFMLCRR